jgi:putative transposase
MQNYRKASHNVYDCTYHIVCVSKYRYSVLVGDIAVRVRDLVREICQENQVEVIRGIVGKNHVHVYVSIPPI